KKIFILTVSRRRSPSRPAGRRAAGRALPTYLDRFHVGVRFSPSFEFPVANNSRGRRGGSLLHNAAMLCARILDDPEIGQCWGCEPTDDNGSCQKLSFHCSPRQSCPPQRPVMC